MAERNVYTLPGLPVPKRPSASSSVDDGGDGPHDGDMRERVAKLEATLGSLATKADVETVRADIHKTDASHKVWMVATVVGLFFGIAALFFGLTSSLNSKIALIKPTSTQQAQPIIIQIPYPAGVPDAQAKAPDLGRWSYERLPPKEEKKPSEDKLQKD